MGLGFGKLRDNVFYDSSGGFFGAVGGPNFGGNISRLIVNRDLFNHSAGLVMKLTIDGFGNLTSGVLMGFLGIKTAFGGLMNKTFSGYSLLTVLPECF